MSTTAMPKSLPNFTLLNIWRHLSTSYNEQQTTLKKTVSDQNIQPKHHLCSACGQKG